MTEIVKCERCAREHAATFARCPFCNAQRVGVDETPFRANTPPPPVETRSPDQIRREATLRAAMARLTTEGAGRRSARAGRGPTAGPRAWLVRAGITMMLGGLVTITVRCSTYRPTPSTRAAELLASRHRPAYGITLASDVDWRHAKRIDLSKPLALAGTAGLYARRGELDGRRVALSGVSALTALIIKTQRITYRRGGVRRVEQQQRVTRIYAPLAGTALRVWVVSEPVNALSATDARVTRFRERSDHSGVVMLLRSVLEYRLLREARDPRLRSVPRDAVAVVAVRVGSRRTDRPLLFGEIAGSGGKLFAVAERRPTDTPLYGDYMPCPSRACSRYGVSLHAAGYFVTRTRSARSSSSPVSGTGVTVLLLGLVLLFGPPLARRILG